MPKPIFGANFTQWAVGSVTFIQRKDIPMRHHEVRRTPSGMFQLHVYTLGGDNRLVAGSVKDTLHVSLLEARKAALL